MHIASLHTYSSVRTKGAIDSMWRGRGAKRAAELSRGEELG
jgi:hypothetical protein